MLLSAFCVVIIIQLYFYLFLFRKYTSYKTTINALSEKGVSIIVAAKNEAINLPHLLPALANQNFPVFEIILVNDASSDDTYSQMNSFKELHKEDRFEITILSLDPEQSAGKKHALTQGIKAARFEHLLLTDADCKPLSTDWIRKMFYSFSEKHEIVLGYGAYEKIEGSWVNKLIRFETLLTAIQYFSYALNGKAYMGVGRNLAYRKTIFKKADGFNKHTHIKSGDDDLFVSQVATAENVAICDDPKSFTLSKPHLKFSEWLRQKRRHITTAEHYAKQVKRSLGLFYLSQFLFYILAVVAMITKTSLGIIIPLILLRFLIWYSTLYKAADKLEEKDLWAFGPLYEISIIFIQLYIFFKNIISPPKYW
ncbi:glycosyltransferase [Lutimonas sp.]|uniref:glycosyltransferase n=1 Tax=Lutimonas sp. TaxID=1872403 RepID=UPI003D9B24AB